MRKLINILSSIPSKVNIHRSTALQDSIALQDSLAQHKEHCTGDGMQSKVDCVMRKQKIGLVLAFRECLWYYGCHVYMTYGEFHFVNALNLASPPWASKLSEVI